MKEILVYSKQNCPACVDLKRALDDSAVDFVELNVDANPVYKKELIDGGFRSVPQVRVDGEWVKDLMEIFD